MLVLTCDFCLESKDGKPVFEGKSTKDKKKRAHICFTCIDIAVRIREKDEKCRATS